MKKFIAIYYTPASAAVASANMTPDQQAKGMEAWYAWKEKCGDAIVDFGAPLMPGQHLGASGNWSGSITTANGYSIVQGVDIESAKALFKGHPHLAWAPGTAIEVHEFAAM